MPNALEPDELAEVSREKVIPTTTVQPRIIVVAPCTFHGGRFTLLLATLLVTIHTLHTTRDDLYAKRGRLSPSMYECQSLWRWSVGYALTMAVCILPDLFALLVQPWLMKDRMTQADRPSSSSSASNVAAHALNTDDLDALRVPARFTRLRAWRGVTASFGMALLVCGTLCMLSSALILFTTPCSDNDAPILWFLVSLPLAGFISVALRASIAEDGGIHRAAQLYIGLAVLLPLLIDSGSGEITGVRIMRRWTRINCIVLALGVSIGVVYAALAFSKRIRRIVSAQSQTKKNQ